MIQLTFDDFLISQAQPKPLTNNLIYNGEKENKKGDVRVIAGIAIQSDIYSLCTLPVGDCNWRCAADRSSFEQIERAYNVAQKLNTATKGHKTRVLALEREIKKRRKNI